VTTILDLAMRNDVLVAGLGIAFPLVGVALSWWSFKWAEEGATPDSYYDPSPSTSIEKEILQHGIRDRARMCARITFNAGALLIAAGVPMGSASQHTHDAINGFAIASYILVLAGFVYCVRQIGELWRSRRANAFSWYYDNNAMPYYYDAEKTAKIFFALNPLPIWTLPDRQWFDKLRKPDIQDVARLAAKTPDESIVEAHPAQVSVDVAPPSPEA
jgi:hypothetical protein